MTTNDTINRHFCIFDYYLDGVFLKWEEVAGECPVLVTGQQWTVNLEDGTQVTGKIVETVMVSENERKVLLSSN
ncbi:MAG: hypothetical protein QNJ53_08910 [Pleurocapsa sp. MO_192.B19]|nr:hypothetical protein [Pleurocapsa sp. MO_192.B19]